MGGTVEASREGAIERVEIDDGKLNVLTLDLVEALESVVSRAAADPAVKCLIVEGNPRALSVGLDTNTVLSGTPEAGRLLEQMGRVLQTLYLSRLRSIVIAQGHATAAGAMLLLVADVRIGCGIGGKVGLSEVGVGLDVPLPTQQLVRDRLGTPHHFHATALARLYDFRQAHAVGYFDELADDREQALALAHDFAERLAALDEQAYLQTKLGMRSAYRALIER